MTSRGVELRDGDAARYGGKGVLCAVRNVNVDIAKSVQGMDALDQGAVDRAMLALDGSAVYAGHKAFLHGYPGGSHSRR